MSAENHSDNLPVDPNAAASSGKEELVLNVIQKLSPKAQENPEELLDSLLAAYFNNTESDNHKRGPKTISSDAIVRARQLYGEGGIVDAFNCLIEGLKEIPISSSAARIQRKKTRTLRHLVQGKSEIPIRPQPRTFILGTHSHQIGERTLVEGLDNLRKLRGGKKIGVNFNDGGLVDSLIFGKTENAPFTPSLFGETHECIHDKEVVLKFPIPIKVPKDKKELQGWIVNHVNKFHRDCFSYIGRIPDRPYDMTNFLKSQSGRNSLLTLIEAGHYLFGELPWGYTDGNDKELEVSLIPPTEFALIDFLTLMRLTKEKCQEPPLSQDKAVLSELALGNIRVNNGCDELGEPIELYIRGGIVDIIHFNMPGIDETLQLPLSKIVTFAEGEFNSQARKYRRTYPDNPNVVYQNKLRRNIRSLFKILSLSSIYKEDIFEKLDIVVDDLKFPAGDGGWFTVFNPEHLPDQAHMEKMNEYLFTVAVQLCWLQKWQANNSELEEFSEIPEYLKNITLDRQEIIEFIINNQLFKRVNGRIRYQLPSKEIIKEVCIPENPLDVEEWVMRILSKKESLMEKERVVNALRTIELLIPEEKRKSLKFIPQKEKPLPEILESFCCQLNGRHYLIIDKLTELIRDDRFEILNLVSYESEGVIVLNLTDKDTNSSLRISVNTKGNFGIGGSGMQSYIGGDLLTTEEMRGIREWPEDRWNYFKDILLSIPELSDKLVEVDSGIKLPNGTIMNSYGEFKRLVNGKPNVCRMNLMRGAWSIDTKLLQEALDGSTNVRKSNGFHTIANAISSGHGNCSTFCPLPDHDNTDTPAAYIYNDSRRGMYIHCFVCDVDITIPEKGRVGESRVSYAQVEGTSSSDYKPVSPSRNSSLVNLFKVGSALFGLAELPNEYLHNRGLEKKNVGAVGYIPAPLSNYLANLMDKSLINFREMVKGKTLNLDSIIRVATAVDSSEVSEYLDGLPPLFRDLVINTFDSKQILNMRARGFIGKNKAGDIPLGGRVLFPMHWVSSKKPEELAISSYVGRGIEKGQDVYYQGVKHFKPYSVKGKNKFKDGKLMLPTPTGVWFKDESFLLNAQEKIIVFESTLNAASFERICPNEAEHAMVMSGTGYRELVAFLRWLGYNEQSSGEVYLAYDFDKGGVEAFKRTEKHLEANFPSLKIHPIHDLLPGDIKEMLPPYDLNLFKHTTAVYDENGEEVEAPLVNFKIDMNDILTAPGIGEQYAYKGLVRELEETTNKLIKNLQKMTDTLNDIG